MIKPNKSASRHIIMKLLKAKDKDILKATRQKSHIIEENTIRKTVDFSSEIRETRRKWHNIVQG